MTAEPFISVGVFLGFSWIRCEGKGSFLNSPAVKAFGDERIAAGEQLLVVDLGDCSGMDSTFMGTLAGLAARISAKPGGVLQVANAGDRNRRSLEDLGLDFLLEIDPPSAAWRGRVDEIRDGLARPGAKPSGLGALDRAKHVLEAHETLSGLNERNEQEFKQVVRTLGEQVQSKEGGEGSQAGGR